MAGPGEGLLCLCAVFVLAGRALSGCRPRQHERANSQGPLRHGRDQWGGEAEQCRVAAPAKSPSTIPPTNPSATRLATPGEDCSLCLINTTNSSLLLSKQFKKQHRNHALSCFPPLVEGATANVGSALGTVEGGAGTSHRSLGTVRQREKKLSSMKTTAVRSTVDHSPKQEPGHPGRDFRAVVQGQVGICGV